MLWATKYRDVFFMKHSVYGNLLFHEYNPKANPNLNPKPKPKL